MSDRHRSSEPSLAPTATQQVEEADETLTGTLLSSGGQPTEGSAALPTQPATLTSSDTQVSLVGETSEVVSFLADRRARVFSASLAAMMLFGLTTVPLNPHPETHGWGFVMAVVLFLLIAGIRLVRRQCSPAHFRRFYAMLGFTLFWSGLMTAFFGPWADFTAVTALALVLISMGGTVRTAMIMFVCATAPYLAISGLTLIGWLPDVGFYVMPEGRELEKVAVIVLVVLMFVMGTILGLHVATRSARTLEELASVLREVAARDALIQDARLELERAAGIGMGGRFTGQRFGPFVLGDLIGRGGMSEVYYGESDSGAGAVKLLRTDRASQVGGEELIERFQREAAAVRGLSSPHIAQVLASGDEQGVPFIAFELLIGNDLAFKLRRQLTLDVHEALALISHVADGLEVAHGAGLVHCDIKPQNLFQTETGLWKILDFGIAEVRGQDGDAEELAGTPAYMAPEQLRQGSVDNRVDVHALGAVAYRALTGRPVFSGRDNVAIIKRVLYSLPPSPSGTVGVSEAFDDVLRIALAKSRDDRFQSIRELAEAFRVAASGGRDPSLRERARKLNERLSWQTH